jgi:hypothetical protein
MVFSSGTEGAMNEFIHHLSEYNPIPIFSLYQLEILAAIAPYINFVVHVSNKAMASQLIEFMSKRDIDVQLAYHYISDTGYKKEKIRIQDWKLNLFPGNKQISLALDGDVATISVWTKNNLDRFIYTLVGLPILNKIPHNFLFTSLPIVEHKGFYYPPTRKTLYNFSNIEPKLYDVRQVAKTLIRLASDRSIDETLILIPESPVLFILSKALGFHTFINDRAVKDLVL